MVVVVVVADVVVVAVAGMCSHVDIFLRLSLTFLSSHVAQTNSSDGEQSEYVVTHPCPHSLLTIFTDCTI